MSSPDRYVVTVAGRQVEYRPELSAEQALAIGALLTKLAGGGAPGPGPLGPWLFAMCGSPPDGSDWRPTWALELCEHLEQHATPAELAVLNARAAEALATLAVGGLLTRHAALVATLDALRQGEA